jgi:hypothetical protein
MRKTPCAGFYLPLQPCTSGGRHFGCCFENFPCDSKDGKRKGTCVDFSTVPCMGKVERFLCPGDNSVKCCFKESCGKRYANDALLVIPPNKAVVKALADMEGVDVDIIGPHGAGVAVRVARESLDAVKRKLSEVGSKFDVVHEKLSKLIADDEKKMAERLVAKSVHKDLTSRFENEDWKGIETAKLEAAGLSASQRAPGELAPSQAPTQIALLERGDSDSDSSASGSGNASAISACLCDAKNDTSFFSDYQPLCCIHEWLREKERAFPNLVQLRVLGASFEGNDLLAAEVGTRKIKEPGATTVLQEGDKVKSLFIQGGIHAREWISPASVLYTMHSLLEAHKSGGPDKRYLDEMNWVFLPVMNPDGYLFTWPSLKPDGDCERLWRKTRSVHTDNGQCVGVDANRNFELGFGAGAKTGATNACSYTYAGPKPLSEVEVQHVVTYVHSRPWHFYTDVHAFSQLVLYPYGFAEAKDEAPPPETQALAEKMAKVPSVRYTAKPASGLYIAGG